MFPQLVLAVALVRGTELILETAARKGKQKLNERKERNRAVEDLHKQAEDDLARARRNRL